MYRPPISTLSDDILYTIFCENTFTEGDFTDSAIPGLPTVSPLITARYSSQVCRQWRNCILGGTQVWAESLDMEHLPEKRPEWLNEVLSRTFKQGKPTPLSVKTVLTASSRSSEEFFDFVSNHWGRIRQLKVTVLGGEEEEEDISDVVEDERWDILTHPSTILQTLNIDFGSHDICPLYINNDLPLRNLIARALPLVLSEVKFKEMRYLNIADTVLSFEVVTALGHMPLLEDLRIYSDTDGQDGFDQDCWKETQDEVHLPRLRNLSIDCSLITAIGLLVNIKPTAGCNFFCNVRNEFSSTEVSSIDLSRFQNGFKNHFKSYLDHGSNGSLSVVGTQKKFEVKNSNRDSFSFPSPKFVFRMTRCYEDSVWLQMRQTIVATFSSMDLSSVRVTTSMN